MERQRPKRRCERSVSLSSALKKPNSRGDKKVVHFADSLGLDLVHILPFHQRAYITPVKPQEAIRKISTVTPPSSTYLHLLFTTIGGYAWEDTGVKNNRLIEKTFRNGICLKTVETRGTNITGTIAVVNYEYAKEVYVRYTLDNWSSYIEVPAVYIYKKFADNIDMFSFSLFLPQMLPVGAKCEFCLRYRCGGRDYWDNNDTGNYVVEVRSLNFDQNDEDEGIYGLRYGSKKWL
ncbi:unnamed protein product [Enterobius vermicularis]|uniref:CBM21 domain-containing protein n=1 Tax=Enterobius vermicularis TaxID=51028 RepID=A0A0N4V4T6_ENTVE|nr:unnamed protein product [Enterobius vermicularis]